jgi:hypothetical protein
LCESHDHLFAGHNAAQKTYITLMSSNFWPNVYTHVLKHTQTCFWCQQRKTFRAKHPPLAPLPSLEQPNIRIHADLFGPIVNVSTKMPMSCASPMLSQNMRWSLKLKTRRPKQ